MEVLFEPWQDFISVKLQKVAFIEKSSVYWECNKIYRFYWDSIKSPFSINSTFSICCEGLCVAWSNHQHRQGEISVWKMIQQSTILRNHQRNTRNQENLETFEGRAQRKKNATSSMTGKPDKIPEPSRNSMHKNRSERCPKQLKSMKLQKPGGHKPRKTVSWREYQNFLETARLWSSWWKNKQLVSFLNNF